MVGSLISAVRIRRHLSEVATASNDGDVLASEAINLMAGSGRLALRR